MEIGSGNYSGLSSEIEVIEIDKLVFNTLSIFLSSKSFDDVSSGPDDIIIKLKHQFCYSEIILNLSTIAILLRNSSDTFRVPNSRIDKIRTETVGTLKEDLKSSSSESVSLSLREACNKIIHAKKINFDFEDNEKLSSSYLNPFLHIYGDKNNNDWKATIDIINFLRVAAISV